MNGSTASTVVGEECTNVIELNVRDLPTYPTVHLTGELGIRRTQNGWERNGQQAMGPLSKLILDQQPREISWVAAAAAVTGWTLVRVFAFQIALGQKQVVFTVGRGGGKGHGTEKGSADAALYGLLYKLARKTNR